MTFISTLADCWLGLCRKTPVVHITPVMTPDDSDGSNSVQPGAGSSSMKSPGGIPHGISIAAESIRALFRERQLLWFPLLFGIVILFLVLAEQWNLTHIDYSSAASGLISIPSGSTYLIVCDLRLFLIEAICLSGFTFLLAVLVRFRNMKYTRVPVTFRGVYTGAARHAGTLAALSITMAFAATFLLEISAQNGIAGRIESALSMAMFWLPYAYYFPPDGIFTALFFSFRMMVASITLFLLALYVVPVIVLENKGLLFAIAGSVRLMQTTWRELTGCAFVFGAIILAAALTGLLIGQSPALLNYDYDFFLQASRGQVLMTAACYAYLLACGVLMALGSTVLGVAVTELYAYGTATGRNAMRGDRRVSSNAVMDR